MEIAIRNCAFKFRCEKKWQNLERTDNPEIRYCGTCGEDIHYVHTNKELRKAIEANQCVALVVAEENQDGYPQFVGKVAYRD